MYTLIRKVRNYFVFIFENCSKRRWYFEIFCMFCHFRNIFATLSETRMSCFFHDGILLLLFDNLVTVPTRLSIRLTTVATIPNTVQQNPCNDLPPLLLMVQSLMPFSRKPVPAQRLADQLRSYLAKKGLYGDST